MKKKLLAALLAVCMVASMLFVPATAAATFDDVAEDHWASESIERWAGYGVLTGHGDGTFNPDGPMSREQFASMMVKLLGLTKESGKTFDDVIGSFAWAEKDVDKVATAGIVQGYTDGSFGAGRPVSFESAAVMMSRALGLVTLEESTGDNWADTTVEKLDDLGMLDDNVNADADANRALVAALASNMIGTYVTPDTVGDVTEDGVITGEVSGIILVVGEVEVDIKDATVTAPIVVQGASVTLTNTTAANVKVGGENASVTADEDSTVADVIVGGSDTKVELNGEVTGNVTVAADAAGEVEIVAPEDVEVTNESPVDVTVNGETVEGKPVEEDPENPDDESSTGFVPNPATPVTPPTVATDEEKQPDTVEPPAATATGGTIGGTVTDGKEDCGDDSHTWNNGTTTQPTCQLAGSTVYTCTECGKTKTYTLAKLDHKYVCTEVTDATCTDPGSAVYTCVNGTHTDEPSTQTKTEAIPALGHQQVNSSKAATCTEAGWGVGIACGREGCTKDGSSLDAEKWISAVPSAIPALGHSWEKVITTTEGEDGTTTTTESWKCTRTGCNATSNETCPVDHTKILNTATCSVCKEKGTHDPEGESHTAGTTYGKDATNHWKVCTVPGCGAKVGETAHSYKPGSPVVSGTTYCECGATKTCSKDHNEILTSATCSECGGAGTKEPTTTPDPDQG